jgi:hypothetical protein
MDATIGLEGNGPKAGRPREAGLVLASGDIVALDTVAAQIMGLDPASVAHIQLCAGHELGVCDMRQIEVVGEQVSDVLTPFSLAKHNAVSWLEILLRKSALRSLAFNTPLFALLCWGARRYYDLWDLLIGRRLRAEVLQNSAYAAQWSS